MAKKQTFTSKLNKGGKDFKYVKHIKSVVSEDSGHIKFLHNMVRLEENENLDQALKRMEEESMQGLSFGKPAEEAPAEEAKEAPAEEAKEEAPAEEAPVVEAKEEAPAEEAKEEAPAEEAPAEEAPVEEVKEEAEPATEEESAEKADDSSDK